MLNKFAFSFQQAHLQQVIYRVGKEALDDDSSPHNRLHQCSSGCAWVKLQQTGACSWITAPTFIERTVACLPCPNAFSGASPSNPAIVWEAISSDESGAEPVHPMILHLEMRPLWLGK